MLLVLSPAKTLDFESKVKTKLFSQPVFLDESEELVEQLKLLEPSEIASLMNVSEKLATLNRQRFLEWHRPFTLENSKQALFAFNGDVYEGLAAESLSEADLTWANRHLRILSGLYGLLKPLDLMQPYRLEMGTRFSNRCGKNLYAFWGDKITEKLNQEAAGQQSQVLINLASNEYFKAVKPKRLKGEVITPVFKDWKNGKYKVISFYAKKARGLMTAYIIQNRIEETEKLKAFDLSGYLFSEQASSEKEWVFFRKEV